MKKGNKRKLDIQRATKVIIIEKGYSAVTMADISEALKLSVGGLYYHYHSVEEIFLDIVENETRDVWGIFSEVKDIKSLVEAFRSYHQLEKNDMMNFENTLNCIFYPYFFSFPAEVRKEKMKEAYLNTTSAINTILKKVYKNTNHVMQLSNRIYIMLHGLNILASSGQIDELIIDNEFLEVEKLMWQLYHESEGTQ
ncbi:MAG: TetR/AcrR family transcriptional regulator [Clostridium sp.]|uniref:TetR/AcrR family transcriptional regulator n=1 Tax=Clostridium sp. TaxID=1506 RepID=UPI00290E71C6|nr:TetR/AcrR family transcriptional regulator [Clostridium sp.]MDU7337834.1 TetR/AcrR family transcriptional regulator [Clostridium sp.]